MFEQSTTVYFLLFLHMERHRYRSFRGTCGADAERQWRGRTFRRRHRWNSYRGFVGGRARSGRIVLLHVLQWQEHAIGQYAFLPKYVWWLIINQSFFRETRSFWWVRQPHVTW